MIGPGWMPSRPRPIVRVRRRLVSVLPRRGPRTRPVSGDAATAAAPSSGRLWGRRVRLPSATLLPNTAQGRHRVLSSSFQRWCEQRWMWVRPRMIPLIVAFLGFVGVMNARRYLLALARGPDAPIVAPATGAETRVTPDVHGVTPISQHHG